MKSRALSMFFALAVLAAAPFAASAADTKPAHKAKVISVTDVPQYTYLEVSENNKTMWIATATVAVKKGDTITFADGVAMSDFHSKALNRDFPSITFVDSVAIAK